ncbi:MAG: alpha-hydroxy-acid oxidizing protein [Deltaproteobacteria bacterium]|nr:alpha-hydroxy-acid oxidizing protein [Deltaproteobacteria bacterium]
MITGPGPINLFEFEPIAKGRLPIAQYDYIAGGATDEISVGRNRRAFESIALRPRVLGGVSSVDLSTKVLGTTVHFPVLIAPCGGHKRAHPDGEIATYRAASSHDTIMAVSANSHVSFEDLAKADNGPLWMQLYPFRDREVTKSWLKRAKDNDYKGLCITLDSAWPSKRERNIRNNYQRRGTVNYSSEEKSRSNPPTQRPRNAEADPGASWKDLEWIRSETNLPIVAKGIMTGEDADLCAQMGIEGVIVSNHGGRGLDNTLATIEVLPEVVAAAKGRLEVLLDGGVRRGADVVKALALGAKAVCIGRPLFWGLAVDGADGVKRVLEILREEMEITVARCGKSNVQSIDSSVVTKVPPFQAGW